MRISSRATGRRDGYMSHVLNSRVYGDLFGTHEMREVFSDRSPVQSWLDMEVALARAEAAIGLIPPQAADEIASRAPRR